LSLKSGDVVVAVPEVGIVRGGVGRGGREGEIRVASLVVQGSAIEVGVGLNVVRLAFVGVVSSTGVVRVPALAVGAIHECRRARARGGAHPGARGGCNASLDRVDIVDDGLDL